MKKPDLSHLKPCRQTWEEMTPDGLGRLCHKCQNTVIDFRRMSPGQIAEFRQTHAGPVCGLYAKSQLKAYHKEPRRNCGVGAYLLGVLGLVTAMEAKAATGAPPTEIMQSQRIANSNFSSGLEKTTVDNASLTKDSIIISGTLKTAEGEVIIGANITVLGSLIGVVSGYDGRYTLDITNYIDTAESITIVYSYVGFITRQVTLLRDSISNPDNRTIDVIFSPPLIVSGYTEYYVGRLPLHKRLWLAMKKPFIRKR